MTEKTLYDNTSRSAVAVVALRRAFDRALRMLPGVTPVSWREQLGDIDADHVTVSVRFPGEPADDALGAAIAAGETAAAGCVRAISDGARERVISAWRELVESALGGILRESIVSAERVRLVLARYVAEARNVEEATGTRPAELTDAELLSSLLDRWAEERRGVAERGLVGLVRPTPTAEIEQYQASEALTALRRAVNAALTGGPGQVLDREWPYVANALREALDVEAPLREPGNAQRWQDAPPGSLVEVDGNLVVRWPEPDDRGCDAAMVNSGSRPFRPNMAPLWPYPACAPGADGAAPVRVLATGLSAEACAEIAAGDVVALAIRVEALIHRPPATSADALADKLDAALDHQRSVTRDPVTDPRAGDEWSLRDGSTWLVRRVDGSTVEVAEVGVMFPRTAHLGRAELGARVRGGRCQKVGA